MSTIPFVQVEGVLALPHIRPLDRLPASFGREWALTVPHFSLRTELRALYAAIMRTMCLTAETFRSIYRWDHLRTPAPAAAAPDVRAALASAPAARTPDSRMPVSAPVGQDSRSATVKPAAAMGRSASSRTAQASRHKLAGGAVAIGGAAMLAWIVASHLPRDTAPVSHASAPSTKDNPSHSLADARAEHEQAIARSAAAPVATRESAAPARDNAVAAGAVEASAPANAVSRPAQVAVVSAPVAASTIVITQKASATPATTVAVATLAVPTSPLSPVAPAIGETAVLKAAPTPSAAPVAKLAVAPARVQPDFSVRAHAKAAAPATLVQRSERRNERTLKHAEERRAANPDISVRHAGTRHELRDVHEFAPYRDTAPVTTQRSRGGYSEAEVYSPRQTGANPADEYASVLTYANTHTASPAANRAPVAADNTDWVNHVSQRRVTEVPDRFAK